jgi:membrane-associated phospholipid phosphatase
MPPTLWTRLLDRREEFFARPAQAVGWASALLALVALAAFLVPTGPLALDSRWSELMQDIQTPFLKHLALVFDALGRGVWRGVTLAAIGLLLLYARRWAALIAFALTEALTPLLGNVIKSLVDRPRPPGATLSPHGSSFPSGHAAYAGATAIALVLLFSKPGPRRPLWYALAALVTAGMVWSRTYLQVHWLSDALAGAILGLAITLASFGVVQLTLARAAHRVGRTLPTT